MRTGIYKISAPDDRIYIGQARNLTKRFAVYKTDKVKEHPRLYESVLMYGIESHLFEVIHECGKDELNYWERHYQDLYDVCGSNGLNCRLTKTDEKPQFEISTTVAKRSKSAEGNKWGVGNQNTKGMKTRLGATHSVETKEKISQKAKGNKRWLGKTHTQATKEKSKRSHLFQSKTVICLETGVEYQSVRECCRILQIDRSSVIKYIKDQKYKVKGLSFAWKV